MTQEPEHNPDTAPQPVVGEGTSFRPVTRSERRSNWLHEYGQQDIALQMWVNLIERNDVEIEVMLQMRGLLIFGVMVSAKHYVEYHVDSSESLHREQHPTTADMLRGFYEGLMQPEDLPEIGPEGLPQLYRVLHLREAIIYSGGHKVTVPWWRGRISEVEAFVVGISAE